MANGPGQSRALAFRSAAMNTFLLAIVKLEILDVLEMLLERPRRSKFLQRAANVLELRHRFRECECRLPRLRLAH